MSPNETLCTRSTGVLIIKNPAGGLCGGTSGSGYFTFWLTEAVGPTGKVYAVDVDPPRRRTHYRNIEVMYAKPDDPFLPHTALTYCSPVVLSPFRRPSRVFQKTIGRHEQSSSMKCSRPPTRFGVNSRFSRSRCSLSS